MNQRILFEAGQALSRDSHNALRQSLVMLSAAFDTSNEDAGQAMLDEAFRLRRLSVNLGSATLKQSD